MTIGKNEFTLIEKLLNIDFQIYEALNKIKEEEEQGILKESSLEKIKGLINEEENLIRVISTSKETLEGIITYLFYREELPTNEISVKEYKEAVLANNIDKLLKKRVFNKLQVCYLKKEDSSDYPLDYLKDYPELANQTLKSLKTIYYALHLDYAAVFLAILNEYLEKEKNAKVKSLLYQVKYNYAFIFPEIEADLLTHQMAINPKPKENYSPVSEGYNLEKEAYDELKSGEVDDIFDDIFLNLINIIKNNMVSFEDDPNYLINFIFGRACLALLSLKEFQIYQDSIRITVIPTSMEYAQKNQDKYRLLSEKIDETINELFVHYEVDREIFSKDGRKIN